ncbi:MAG: hypothetical protein RLZZ75_248, partial [Bacteroidota bacterium]
MNYESKPIFEAIKYTFRSVAFRATNSATNP